VAVKRRQVGDAERYHGRRLHAGYMGPDLLGYVDDIELGGFYLTVEAAIGAGRRHVDAEIRAVNEAARKAGRA
jgi:hypothetical protein